MIATTLVLRSNNAVRATSPAGAVSRPNRRYAEARTCEVPACSTELSVYNPRRRCWAHDEPRPSIERVRTAVQDGPVVASLDELARRVSSSEGPRRHPEPPAEPQPEPFPQPGPVPAPEEPS